MSQPEARFKRKLVEAFDHVYPDRSWSAWVKGINKDGVPDLVFCATTRTVWVEAKNGPNAPSAAQRLQLSKLHRARVSGCVLRCSDIREDKSTRLVYVYGANPDPRVVPLSLLHQCSWADIKTSAFWERLFALHD